MFPGFEGCNYVSRHHDTDYNNHYIHNHHHHPHTSTGLGPCYSDDSTCYSNTFIPPHAHTQDGLCDLSRSSLIDYYCGDHCNDSRVPDLSMKRPYCGHNSWHEVFDGQISISEHPREKLQVFQEIENNAQNIIKEGECDKCIIRGVDNLDESISISDLVDIVLQTVDNIKEKKDESVMITKKREQNKVAAAKYRNKQKAKWLNLHGEMVRLEQSNHYLKWKIADLEKEVAEFKTKTLSCFQLH